MDTQGSECIPKSASLHVMMLSTVPTWGSRPRTALVVVFLWETRVEREGQPPAGKNAALPSFSRTPFFFFYRENNSSKEAIADGGLSQCLLNSWEGIIDFGVFWISPSFCRVIILSYLCIALSKPWCHFYKYPATPDLENPE